MAFVLKGYLILKEIAHKYGDKPLSKRVRGQANAAIAGAIASNCALLERNFCWGIKVTLRLSQMIAV